MFAPEGTRPIVVAAALGSALAVAGLLVGGWGAALVALGALGFGATLWFYRDPPRTPPPGADVLVLAPADGTVVEIVDELEPVYLGGASQRVSIALSPLGAHVSRSPATGTVELEHRGRGREVGVRHATGVPVLCRHTDGLWPASAGVPAGRRLSAGERCGLAPLGSRADVAVPPHVELDVAVGQRTVAGETVIGRLPAAASGDGATSDTRLLLTEVA